ncbi:NlpC/P60 family protein [Erythrobacter sp. THAF29]|uniref:NlpC/P60 family protein n=1 Tax=Erythrobacter sp. THAF29 TaxID=2587851 RepID=UPI0012AA7B7E|nr:NlpC/P60 family protein [Erythrobacter sp. THAF29]QFT76147.1 hypothetical protein FIU90_01195 [Erythrobacter sp. THAF29]
MMQAALPGDQLAEAAAAMIGRPFRLYGRNPETGLDCVGLVAASLKAIGRNPSIPRGYTLRSTSIAKWQACFERSGFDPVDGEFRSGDLLVTRPGAIQHHLMIAQTPDTVIHAHAGLRRVVRQPLAHDIIRVAHWRLAKPI